MDVWNGTQQFKKDTSNVPQSWEKMHLWNVTKLWEFQKDLRNVKHGWDFTMNCRKNTHLSMCWWWTVIKAHELSPEYTPFSVLLTNCYRRFPAKQSTILTAEYNPCSPLLIDSPSINHSTSVTGMLQPVRSVTFRAQSVIEVWPSRPNKLQKYDLVGQVSYRSMTLWAQ